MMKTIVNLCAAIFAIGLMSALSGCSGAGTSAPEHPSTHLGQE
jgi:hypothetical protein